MPCLDAVEKGAEGQLSFPACLILGFYHLVEGKDMFTWPCICFKLFIGVGEPLFPANVNSRVPTAPPPRQITGGLWMPYVNCPGS